MDAQEVQHEGRDQEERIDFATLLHFPVAVAELAHRFGSLPGRSRLEAHHTSAIGPGLSNEIIAGLPSTTPISVSYEPIEIPVKLKDGTRRHWNVLKAGVDRCQNVAVACNLLLRAA